MSKVLLVEDDNNLREIYEARLAAEGYEIITAQNGEEALVVAKQNKPDLIISDVMMPRISGFEMLDILRNTDTLRETKVILLTALGQAEDQQRAGKLGADKYLVKSQVTLEDIVNTAKELLGEVSAMAPESVFTKDSAPAAPAATPVAAPLEQPVAPEPVAEAPVAPAASQQAAPAPAPSSAVTPVTAPVAVADTDPIIPVVPELPVQPAPAPAPSVDNPAMPVMPQQVAPAPAPQPVATPVAAPVAVTDPDPITPVVAVTPLPNDLSAAVSPVTPSAPALQTDSAQTTAAEEATVENQIENFTAAAEPQIPVAAPAAAVAAPAAPATTATANDEVLASVVDELTAATNAPAPEVLPPSQRQVPSSPQVVEAPTPVTPEPVAAPAPITEPEVVTPAPAPSSEPVVFSPDLASSEDSDVQSVAGKKVIQPINDISSPGQNLEELLAKEEAKEQLGAAQAVVGGATPAASPVAAPARPSDDPNSIAL